MKNVNNVSNKVYNGAKKEVKVIVSNSVTEAKKEIHKIYFCFNEIRKGLDNNLKQVFKQGNKNGSKFFVNCLLNEISLNDFLRLSKNQQKFSLSQVGNYMIEFATKVHFKMTVDFLGCENETFLNGAKIFDLLTKNNQIENFEINKDMLIEILPLLNKYLTKKEIEILNSFEIDINLFSHLIKDTTKNISKQKSLEIENARLKAQIDEILNNVKTSQLETVE